MAHGHPEQDAALSLTVDELMAGALLLRVVATDIDT